MGKENKAKADIPRFYKRQTFDNLLYGYVNGIQRGLPSISVSSAIDHFMLDFGLHEDIYPKQSALVVYYRCYEDDIVRRKLENT